MDALKNRSAEVDTFMASLDHPLGALVQQIRLAILRAEPEVTEQIKWKAPSFCRDGVDLVTFNLRPTDRVQLIFHRGSKARANSAPFHFEDETGLLAAITEERGQVTFLDAEAVCAGEGQLLALVHAWIRA